MSDRIRELAEQAELNLELQSLKVAKFARLIVRECLKQIYGRTKIAPGDYSWPEKDVGYNEGINAAYKQIKQHFGIE